MGERVTVDREIIGKANDTIRALLRENASLQQRVEALEETGRILVAGLGLVRDGLHPNIQQSIRDFDDALAAAQDNAEEPAR